MLKRILDRLVDLTGLAAGACIVLMMAHVTVDVVLRYFFDLPLTGTFTFVANYYMIFLVCLPLAFVERLDAHISADVVTGRLPERVRHHLYGLTYPVTATIFAVTTYATWIEATSKYAIRTFVIEKTLAIPIWFGYFALPIGYALLTLYLMFKFVAYLSGAPIEPPRRPGSHDLPAVGHE